MVLITVEMKPSVCLCMRVNGGVSRLCVRVSVYKKVQIYTWMFLVCVSRHRAETELEAADSNAR